MISFLFPKVAKSINQLEEQMVRLKDDNQMLLLKNEKLEDRLFNLRDAIQKGGVQAVDTEPIEKRSKQKLDDLTGHIKEAIARVNNDTITKAEKEKSKQTQYLIDEFDVEIKGGISLENKEIFFTQLNAAELNPQSVSTVRFKVKPIIKTKII